MIQQSNNELNGIQVKLKLKNNPLDDILTLNNAESLFNLICQHDMMKCDFFSAFEQVLISPSSNVVNFKYVSAKFISGNLSSKLQITFTVDNHPIFNPKKFKMIINNCYPIINIECKYKFESKFESWDLHDFEFKILSHGGFINDFIALKLQLS